MAYIDPIDDAYIDSIIKSAREYQPSLNKTQGAQLRELLKLFRNRFEQEINTVKDGQQQLSFGNGLKQQGDRVELGGDYTGEIRIGGTADHPVFLIGSNEAGSTYTSLNVNGADYAAGTLSNKYGSKLSSSLYLLKNLIEASIKLEDNGEFKILVTDQIGNKGLEEAGDYSANKTPYSYITKKMLDTAIADLATVATSGKYEDLTGTPSKLSDFNNDLDLSGLAKKDGINVTGTWNIDITGNSVLAGNASKWGNLEGQYLLTGGVQSDGLSAVMGVHGNGYAYQFNAASIKNFLGLRSLAYRDSLSGSEISSGPDLPPSSDIGTAHTLRWKNYGQSHVIFDASQGISPNGTTVDNVNSAIEWSGTYPTLMGWNGANTYGVRVDRARIADTANGWFGQTYSVYDGPVNTYMMSYGNDGQYHPTSVSYVRGWLGLGSGAYNDKTQLWSSTHPNDFYISNSWDGTYWQLKSNHGSPVSVGHADDSTYFNGASVDRFQRYYSFGTDANNIPDNTTSFTYAVNAPYVGTLMDFGANGYGTQFNTAYGAGTSNLAFRSRNGDGGTWNAWASVWHNFNLNPQVDSVPDSVVKRTVNGYIHGSYFNSARGEENLAAAQYLYDTGDGYLRKKNVYATAAEITGLSRHWSLRNDSGGTAYHDGTLELINYVTRPSLGLHWAGVVASTITVEASGRIAIMNNPGTSYENLVANSIAATSDLVVSGAATITGTISASRGIFGFDAGINGGVSASNWFRSSGGTGWYNNDYQGGIHMTDVAWVRVFNGKGFLVENVVMATEFHATSGGFYDLSDANLKEELDQKYDVRSVKTRTYLKAGKVETGYFAQDVEAIMPHSVVKNSEDHLLLNYNQVLVAKVANLEEDIAEMQRKIDLLSELIIK